MIVVISRFGVANGMENQVEAAFRARPRQVDSVAGFLGLEVFCDHEDARVFHLVTRWTDVAAYRSWHRSEQHASSHQLIPKGLELDAELTELRIIERIGSQHPSDLPLSAALDHAVLTGAFIGTSETLHAARCDEDGSVAWMNAAFRSSVFGATVDPAQKHAPIFSWMSAPAAEALRDQLALRTRDPREELLLHFHNVRDEPFDLLCRVDRDGDGFFLLGEPPRSSEIALVEQLQRIQAELSNLSREQVKRAHELERAKRDLEEAYWHIEKIHEVLPMCMECGKVKSSDAKWSDVVSFLKNHSDFISHGYCPDCSRRLMAELDDELGPEP